MAGTNFRHNRCGSSFPANHVNQTTFRCPGCGQALDPEIVEKVKAELNGAPEQKAPTLRQSSFAVGVTCHHCLASNQAGKVCAVCGKDPHGNDEPEILEDLEIL